MSGRVGSWAAAAAVSLFYLCFPSRFYNFDGVACAIAVELGDYSVLVHANHLGYGVLARLFFRLWQLLGYDGPAMLALQTLNSLLGGAAAGVFYSALSRARIPALTAAAATAGLALSQAYWLWSLEAQVYPLGVLGAALVLREALAAKPRPVPLALAHALAILGHVGHLMLGAAAVFALWRRAEGRRAALRRYVAVLAATLWAVYLWAALFCISSTNWETIRLWLLGSAALGVDRGFSWHGGFSPWEWSRMTLRIFSDFLQIDGSVKLVSAALAAAAISLAAFGAWRGRIGRRYEVVFSGLWLAGYAALFMSWEAYTVVYRISDLLPLWLLIAFAFEQGRGWLIGAFAAALGLVNGVFFIPRFTDAGRNVTYQEALWLRQAAPADAWIVVSGLGQVYVPYFAHRRSLNMRFFERQPQALARRLDDLARRGERVYVTERTLAAGGEWSALLRDYGLKPAPDEPGLFEVRRKESPAEGRKKD